MKLLGLILVLFQELNGQIIDMGIEERRYAQKKFNPQAYHTKKKSNRGFILTIISIILGLILLSQWMHY